MKLQCLRMAVCAFAALSWISPAHAQAPGLPPEWEVRKNMTALAEQVQRFKPILQEVKPAEWTGKGAPEAYHTQWQSIAAETDFLVGSTEELSRQPEKLTLALETFLRLQAVEAMLGSLNEGVRRYQNPALADLLQSLMSENGTHREKLREYVVALAAAKEQELKIMHEEAQRCRAAIFRQPPSKAGPGREAKPQ